MTTIADAIPVLRALLACNECGGTGVDYGKTEPEHCPRCAEVPDLALPFRVDPDHIILDGECIPPEERYHVIFDPADIYRLPV